MTRYQRKKAGIKPIRHIIGVRGVGMCGERRDDVVHVLVMAHGRSNCDLCKAKHRDAIRSRADTFTTVVIGRLAGQTAEGKAA